jgi:hypothetical protein
LRRKRWTVICRNGRQVIILAHTCREVGEYCLQRGLSVKHIIRGGCKTDTPHNGDFRVNLPELKLAARKIKLSLPVQISFMYCSGTTDANYSLENKSNYLWHKIMLKGYLTPERANTVLWHELRHAWQAEKDSYSNWMERVSDEWKIPYEQRPMEIDAISFSEEHQHQLLVDSYR